MLGTLRAGSIFCMLILLLSPILKCNHAKEQKPIVELIVDNSSSLRNYAKFNNKEAKAKISTIHSKLLERGFEVSISTLSDEGKPIDSIDFTYTKTNLFNQLQSRLDINYENNLAGIYLLSDGNYNEGNNPIFVQNGRFIPISPILVGDTIEIPDARVNSVVHNRILLSNDVNEIHANISLVQMRGRRMDAQLYDVNTSKIVATRSVTPTTTAFSQNIEYKLDGLSKGKHHYRIQLSNVAGERNLKNNSYDFFVEVVDGIKKIHIYSAFPHPDISAIKSALSKNKSYQVQWVMNGGFKAESDLAIFYQYSSGENNNMLKEAKSKGISALYILGTQTDYTRLNTMDLGWKADLSSNMNYEIFPILNEGFSRFYLKDNFKTIISSMPPLNNQMVQIRFQNESANLLSSKIGFLNTNQPVIGFGQEGMQRFGIINGENIWRWRVINYKYQGNSNFFDDLMEKTVNYLAITKDKRQLTTATSSISYQENEQVRISASTYNEMYQPTKADKVECFIAGDNGVKRQIEMLYNGGAYLHLPNNLPHGNYSYRVVAHIGGKVVEDKGSFSITKESIEQEYLPANYSDMNLLANKSNGKLYDFDHINRLISDIDMLTPKAKYIEDKKTWTLLDLFPYLVVLLLLICIEWILRKYFGFH